MDAIALRTLARPAPTPRDPALDIARGVLIVLAVAPVVALAPAARATPHLSAIGEMIVAPGLMFLAGLIAAPRLGAPRRPFFARRVAAPLAMAGLAAGLALLVGAALRGKAGAGLALAAPALQLMVLPPLHALVVRMTGPTPLVLALALFAHVVGVIGGPGLRFALSLFVFYAAGVWFATRRARFEAAIARHPFAAAMGAPVVFAFALFLGLKAPAQAFSFAAAGPGALVAGLGAGVAALAMASALATAATAGDAPSLLGRLGRAARPLGMFWPPLFLALALAAPQAARPLALIVLAAATLAIVATLADLFAEWRASVSHAIAGAQS